MKKLWLGATLAVIALVCVRPAAAQIGIVSVTGGRVEGVLDGGITSFKGIPFAAPPVGNLRWRAPRPVTPWKGIKQADHFGPSCTQAPGPLVGVPPTMSENCLYLNVWTPARSAGERLPVMVWIYGGAFTGGSASMPVFDGTHFAQKGVVLVSFNYRVGVFGFLADRELDAESSHHVSGNYGLRDMIAALKWVRANIARFGGDPSRVTIFGESAGGMAVSMLVVSPPAKGLFQRAISESGGSVFAPPIFGNGSDSGLLFRPLALGEVVGQHFLAKLGARDIAAARALPADVIQKAAPLGLPNEIWPVFDGDVLPADGYDLYQAHRFNDVPILAGTNADEGRLFIPPGVTPAQLEARVRAGFGNHANAVLAAYAHATNAEAEQADRNLFRDAAFAWDTWAWARLQSKKGEDKAYLYYFDRRSPQAPLGPTHGAEIGYVFGTWGSPGVAGLRGPPGPADIALSDLMQSYWVNFAKTGDPNGAGLPVWPAFDTSSQRVMYLDAHSHAGPVPNMRQLKVLDQYFASRRAEAGKKESAN